MKKEKIYQVLYAIAMILAICFIIFVSIDFVSYDEYSNSAPFYVRIIERAVEFIIPSIVMFIIGKIVKKKYAIEEGTLSEGNKMSKILKIGIIFIIILVAIYYLLVSLLLYGNE